MRRTDGKRSLPDNPLPGTNKNKMENDKRVGVLIAAAPISVKAIAAALSDEFDVDYVSSLADATSCSYKQIDVILCGLCFDESRMFDLLRYTQLHPRARALPFICISAVEHTLSGTITQSIEIACRALGGAGFIDLNRWYREYGVASANVQFRQLVRQAARL